MKRVLVTGASGFLGATLTRVLHDKGYQTKVIVRKGASLKGIEDTPCEVCYGSIDNKEDIAKALQGCDIVIHAACITGQWGISFAEYERVNFLATKYIADLCIEQNVEKLIYVSSANTIGPGKKNDPG